MYNHVSCDPTIHWNRIVKKKTAPMEHTPSRRLPLLIAGDLMIEATEKWKWNGIYGLLILLNWMIFSQFDFVCVFQPWRQHGANEEREAGEKEHLPIFNFYFAFY